MQLADPRVLRLLQLGDDLLGGQRVGPRVAGLGLEGAELAVGVADVCVREPTADHVVGRPAVLLEPNVVGQGPHAREVRRLVEQQPILEAQALATQYFVRQGEQARVTNPGLQ